MFVKSANNKNEGGTINPNGFGAIYATLYRNLFTLCYHTSFLII